LALQKAFHAIRMHRGRTTASAYPFELRALAHHDERATIRCAPATLSIGMARNRPRRITDVRERDEKGAASHAPPSRAVDEFAAVRQRKSRQLFVWRLRYEPKWLMPVCYPYPTRAADSVKRPGPATKPGRRVQWSGMDQVELLEVRVVEAPTPWLLIIAAALAIGAIFVAALTLVWYFRRPQ
jgi:hypothetical protein